MKQQAIHIKDQVIMNFQTSTTTRRTTVHRRIGQRYRPHLKQNIVFCIIINPTPLWSGAEDEYIHNRAVEIVNSQVIFV